jgi:hypothetical protein
MSHTCKARPSQALAQLSSFSKAIVNLNACYTAAVLTICSGPRASDTYVSRQVLLTVAHGCGCPNVSHHSETSTFKSLPPMFLNGRPRTPCLQYTKPNRWMLCSAPQARHECRSPSKPLADYTLKRFVKLCIPDSASSSTNATVFILIWRFMKDNGSIALLVNL